MHVVHCVLVHNAVHMCGALVFASFIEDNKFGAVLVNSKIGLINSKLSSSISTCLAADSESNDIFDIFAYASVRF